MRAKSLPPSAMTGIVLLFGVLCASGRVQAQVDEAPKTAQQKTDVGEAKATAAEIPSVPGESREPKAACTTKNLISNAQLFAIAATGEKRVVQDGRLAQEGTVWNASGYALVLKDEDANVIVDLSRPAEIKALVIQADNNDSYVVESSLDGVTYQPFWTAPITTVGQGLRTRTAKFKATRTARYLRINGKGGDGYYSLSEVRAYCQVPKAWPPRLKMPPKKRGWAAIDNDVMVAIKGWLAVFGSLLLLGTFVFRAWQWARRYRVIQSLHDRIVAIAKTISFRGWLAETKVLRRIRDVLLAFAGFVAFISWWNIGHYHFDHYIHIWEHYHYYIGAKYGPELRYSRIYECTAAADLDDGLYKRVKDRKMRDLITNELGTTEAIIKDPSRCKRHFTNERWEEFKKDIRWFRARFSVERWNQSQNDHGYNGTPVWALLAKTLTDISDITWSTTIKLEMFDYQKVVNKILALGVIDSVLLVIMWGVVWWAFGWRATCVALLYWGCNFPARYYWNGGSFLRYDWLVWMVIGICLLKKEKMATGGFVLTYATLLRIFPGMVVVAMIAKALYRMVQEKRFFISKEHLRFAVGCIVALVILLPLSSWPMNGFDAWAEFAENSSKHLSTPLTNNMGLKTVLGYNFATRAIKMRDNKLEDPFKRWKDARRYYYAKRKPLFFALIAVFLILLGKAGTKGKDWESAALGTGLIAVAAELTCYYYGFLLTYGFFWDKRKFPGVAVVVLAAVTCLFPQIWGWNDDHFAAMSLATVITAYAVVGQIAFEGEDWRGIFSGIKSHPVFKALFT